jgi:predicted ATPase
MKLVTIYFDAFKSLLNKELEIRFDCMGFVGSNESGKSNILEAINVLSGNRPLSISDTPKMSRLNKPRLRFKFKLEDKEFQETKEFLNKWCAENTTHLKNISFSEFVTFYIYLDKDTNEEFRYFEIDEINFNSDDLILKAEKLNNKYKVLHNGEYRSLNNSIIINAETLKNNNALEFSNELEELIDLITNEENLLKNLLEEKAKLSEGLNKQTTENTEVVSNELVVDTKEIEERIKQIQTEINKKTKKVETLNTKKEEIELKIQDFNIVKLINELKNESEKNEMKISGLESDKTTLATKIKEIESVGTATDAQKKELLVLKKNYSDIINQISKIQENIELSNENIESLKEPLSEKYTNDIDELSYHLDSELNTIILKYLPKVVYWEHNNNYILSSETLFSEILSKSNLNEISRPLVNIFRIGLGIRNYTDLKDKIEEIQNDSNERSRIAKTLNKKINEYIKKVWGDYDQDINITLEKEQIRIEFYDPKKDNASYYNMEERSQGCQTFLSFLLTIGAEAKHGVIKNTILLLDEPESHLHPSGVRFMLKELIKISENNNFVAYATHSIFLIDRENLDRHIILKKQAETTHIIPANVGRIGYFIQEEVIYNALDVNINSDFTASSDFNFVFEGDGDAVLFEHYYNVVLSKDTNRPFKLSLTSFFQGGKCSDIIKYFSHKPIKLTTKWVFVLDKDKPADELKQFLESKFKGYIGKDILIFQYSTPKFINKEIELEDLLPAQILINSYIDTFNFLEIEHNQEDIATKINESLPFIDYDSYIVNTYVEQSYQIDFKGKFKEVLNKNIKSTLDKQMKEDKFKETYPEYCNWVIEVIDNLKANK